MGEEGASASRVTQAYRDPAGPAAQNARNAHPEVRARHLRCTASLVGAQAAARAAIACYVTVVVRPAHTPTCAPAPRSITASWRPQLAYAPGNWPFVGQRVLIRIPGASARSPIGLGILQPVDQFGGESDRILLVREVPQSVEQPPAVRGFDVLAGSGRAPRAHHGVERAVQMERRAPGRGRFIRRLNWMPSGRAMERTIQRYGSIEQCAVDGMDIARRYVSTASSSGRRGPDQSRISSADQRAVVRGQLPLGDPGALESPDVGARAASA